MQKMQRKNEQHVKRENLDIREKQENIGTPTAKEQHYLEIDANVYHTLHQSHHPTLSKVSA